MASRKNVFEEKRASLSKYCNSCIFPKTPERCDECTIGRRLRLLEVEYSDITGFSHSRWRA